MDDENPFAAPQADLDPADFAIEGDCSVVRDENTLLMPEGAQLPTRCVKCNRPGNTEWKVTPHQRVASRSLTMAVLLTMPGAVLLLVLVYFGISGWWLSPYVLLSLGIVLWIKHHEPQPPYTIFYLCPKHNLLRYAAAAFWVAYVTILLADLWLSEWFGFEFDAFFELPYPIVILGFIIAINFVVPQVSGKKLESGLNSFHGFGEKYLKNFPTIEQQGAVFDEA